MNNYNMATVKYKDDSHPEEQSLAPGRTAYTRLTVNSAFHQRGLSSWFTADNTWLQYCL